MVLYNIVKQSFLLVTAAIAGGLLYLLLPYAWIVAGSIILGKKAIKGLVALSERDSSFAWDPLRSYLTGKKEKRNRK